MKAKSHCNSNSSAFSLIELLVTLAILAAIAIFVLPAFRSASQSTKTTQCLSNLRNFSLGVLAYAQDNRGLPYWDGNGSASQTLGSTYPNFELWTRPYVHQTLANRLRCPLITQAQRSDNAYKNWFNYNGNGAICIYYPKLQGIPAPVSRVVLAAEIYAIDGSLNHYSHLNMTMWGVSEAAATDASSDFEKIEGARVQYHGGKKRRSLSLFFLDGHAALVQPEGGNWHNEPTYGTATNGGLFYDKNQFKAMRTTPVIQ